jgi:hypothetical protein
MDVAQVRLLQRRIVWTLVALLVTLTAMYGYFLSTSIVNVIVREEMQQKIANTNARISELELTYIEAKNAVTMDMAKEMGFTKVTQKHYVTRTSSGERFTLREIAE